MEVRKTHLQQLRQKRGLTRKALSELSGISIRTIECYEQKRRPIDGAGLENLCLLAIALDCKVEDLIESEALKRKYKAVK